MDPQKLKVVELRAELSKRGLDIKGNKPVLVERLRNAINQKKDDIKTHSGASHKSEKESDSENEENSSDIKTFEQIKLVPKTPSRSSRYTSNETTTLVRTPTRRSTSKSLLSRQSPIKTSLAENLIETSSILEQVIEESEASSKTDVTTPIPEKESLPATSKKEAILATPKKMMLTQTFDTEITLITSPKTEDLPTPFCQEISSGISTEHIAISSPKKENVQNESLKLESEVVKQTKRYDVISQITRTNVEDVNQKVIVNSQSLVKSDSQSSKKSVILNSIQQITETETGTAYSPDKTSTQKLDKSDFEKTIEADIQGPMQNVLPGFIKISTPSKIEQSQIKDTTEFSRTESNSLEEQQSKDKPFYKKIEDEQENHVKNDEQHEAMDEKKEDKKRKRPLSPQEEIRRAPPAARPENEPEYDDNAVLLSWYDSDLNLVINTTNYFAASPMQGDGFNYMWAGVRISHGFTTGRIFFEARISTEYDNMSAVGTTNQTNSVGAIPADEEKVPSLLRLGWSTISSSLQLGEDKLSFGYEGTGYRSVNKEFSKYGKAFSKNDVIGCYADFDIDSCIVLTYTVNGESQGPAFEIKKEDLEGKALFPHVLSKNCTFAVNLGQEEAWSTNVLDGYQFINKVNVIDRVVGPRRPARREDCEVILLCGLPFSGKTSWALKHVAENPDKLYNVLGTHNLIDKMRVDGIPLKDTYKGKWETVVEKCSRALTKLLEFAPSRRRNYILDQQANVYGSAQKRKMRNFYGFHRKAVILVPSDEEFKSRIAARKKEAGGKEIRESSILEVKANFNAPAIGESFEEVVWAELREEEGKKLIQIYNTEGKTAGYGQSQQQMNKRSRFDNGQKDRNHRDNRDQRRSGYNDRRINSSWRGGTNSGWRDMNRMRGQPIRHSGGYGSPGAWRGRGGASLSLLPRSGSRSGNVHNRRLENERTRQLSGQRSGGWNAIGYPSNQHGCSSVWSNQSSWQGLTPPWGGQSSTNSTWNPQQQPWAGNAASNWKAYGQNSYGQSTNNYAQSGSADYGTNNWNNWSSQYYNQYWSGGGQQFIAQTNSQTQVAQKPSGHGHSFNKK